MSNMESFNLESKEVDLERPMSSKQIPEYAPPSHIDIKFGQNNLDSQIYKTNESNPYKEKEEIERQYLASPENLKMSEFNIQENNDDPTIIESGDLASMEFVPPQIQAPGNNFGKSPLDPTEEESSDSAEVEEVDHHSPQETETPKIRKCQSCWFKYSFIWSLIIFLAIIGIIVVSFIFT